MILAAPITVQRQALRGFGDFDAAHHALGQAAEAASEFFEMALTDQSSVGRSMLISRGSEIASDLGLPISWDQLLDSTVDQLAFLENGLAAVPGGGAAEALIQGLFGSQVASSFLAQGETVQTLVRIAREVESKFGETWSDITSVMGDLSGIIDGGVRSVMEDLIPEGTEQWLNGRTVNSVVGIARTWSSAVDYSRPGSIVAGVGGTISLAGVACPPPANAVVAAVGGVVSLIGSLIDLFIGNSDPPREADPCMYTRLPDADAWAVLRLYLYATGEVGSDVSMEEFSRAGSYGWNARFDPYTGEALVQRPGERTFRRIIDVFDRRVLLDAYESGALFEWLAGRQSIPGADPYHVGSSNWLAPDSGGENALYCSLSPAKDSAQRGFGSMSASTARRFRVYDDEMGKDVNTRTDHGPRAIARRTLPELSPEGAHSQSPFWCHYRAGLLVSAFLGGTTPFGLYDSTPGGLSYPTPGAICSGVGGWVDPEGVYTYPFVVSKQGLSVEDWQRSRFGILVGPPRRRSRSSSAADATNPGRYTPEAGGPPTMLFPEVARAILSSDDQRVAWNVPGRSPLPGEVAPEVVFRPRTGIFLAPQKVDLQLLPKSGSSGGMSLGGKIALGATGVVLVGGGLYLWHNSRRKG